MLAHGEVYEHNVAFGLRDEGVPYRMCVECVGRFGMGDVLSTTFIDLEV